MSSRERCRKKMKAPVELLPAGGYLTNGAPGLAAPPKKAAPAPDSEISGKIMAIFAYVLFFVPILAGAYNQSEELRFHSNQGTVLFIFALLYAMAYSIASTALVFIPYVGWAFVVLLEWGSLGIAVLSIIGIIHAVRGQCTPLPLIGKITIIK